MTTYPNQKVIHINKNKYTANFLQVGIDEWQTAFKKFTPSAFAVYLYLASNADGFDLALSQKAIENALGIKKTSYHDAIEALKKEGYIEVLQGNIEVFHTTPVRKCEPEIIKEKPKSAKTNLEVRKNELPTPQMRNTNSAKTNLEVRKNDREIDIIDNNINKINKIDIGDFVASQQNPATSLASQVSSVSQGKEQVEAVAADKVITINCSDMRDSYYHLYKYLAKYQPALASFVVNGVAFCRSNKERTDKAIEICNTYGYTIEFNDTAAAVAGA